LHTNLAHAAAGVAEARGVGFPIEYQAPSA